MSELAICKYLIKSANTEFKLLAKDEVDGHVVVTGFGSEISSPMTVNPCVTGSVTHVTITGPKKLYVALDKNAGDGDRLIWSKEKYEWTISLVIGSNTPDYMITPRSGQDLYWTDTSGTQFTVPVRRGRNVKIPEHYWWMVMAPK